MLKYSKRNCHIYGVADIVSIFSLSFLTFNLFQISVKDKNSCALCMTSEICLMPSMFSEVSAWMIFNAFDIFFWKGNGNTP